MERYFYLTIPRILNILACVSTYILLGCWLFNVTTSPSLELLVAVAFGYACCVTIYFLGFVGSTPPYVTSFGDSLDFTSVFGVDCYTEDGSPLGVCEGAYLTKQDIRLMVNGKFYDINDVYFDENVEGDYVEECE